MRITISEVCMVVIAVCLVIAVVWGFNISA